VSVSAAVDIGGAFGIVVVPGRKKEGAVEHTASRIPRPGRDCFRLNLYTAPTKTQ